MFIFRVALSRVQDVESRLGALREADITREALKPLPYPARMQWMERNMEYEI